MNKFTEVFYDDALRLAQFLSERFNEKIEPVEMDSEGFPMPAKGELFSERTQALLVGDYAIAFLRKRTNSAEDRKHRNRNLYRIQFGIKMREARERANMTLEDLADYSGLNENNLKSIEKGRFNVSIDQIGSIASALGCVIDFVDYK